jgi:hypothetical protein
VVGDLARWLRDEEAARAIYAIAVTQMRSCPRTRACTAPHR